MLSPSMNSPLRVPAELQLTDSDSSLSSPHHRLNKNEYGAHFLSTKKNISAVRAVVPRSAEQSSRLLLSSAFRYDTMEAEQNRKYIQQNKHPLLTVKLHFLSLSGSFLTSRSSSGEGPHTTSPTSEKETINGDIAGDVEETAEEGAAGLNDRSSNKKRSGSKKREVKKASKERGTSKKNKREIKKGQPTENESGENEASSGNLFSRNSPTSTTRLSSAVPFSSQASLLSSAACPVEVNIAIFDPLLKLFITAAYRLPIDRMEKEPLVFQAAPHQLVVVELLTCVRIPPCVPQISSDEERRVIAWGFCEVQSLEKREALLLCGGNGQLLYIDPKLWPRETSLTTKENQLGALKCVAQVNQDRSLIRLMTELVPPGLIVPYSFALDTPHPHGSTFQVEIESITLQASCSASEDARDELMNFETQWSVAVVAHNGYQQLSDGDEVPLRFPKRRRAKPRERSNDPNELGKGIPREKTTSRNRKEREKKQDVGAKAKKKRSSSSSPRRGAFRSSRTGINATSLYSTGSYTTYDRTDVTSSTSSSTSSSNRDKHAENDNDGESGTGGGRKKNTNTSVTGHSGGYSLFTKKGEKGRGTSVKGGVRDDDESTGSDTGVPLPGTKEDRKKWMTTSHSPRTKESLQNDGTDVFNADPRSVASTLFKGLESQYPIVLSSLPVHASTSIVLAIRRRRFVSTRAFHASSPPSPSSLSAHADSITEVIGFCVFPLCLLPMKDRDLRVENLPALQGPFSCHDARLLLAESITPYSPLPFTLTLSLAFRGTTVPGERTIEEDVALEECLQGEKKPKVCDEGDEQVTKRKEERHRKHHHEEKKEIGERITMETVPIVPDSVKTEGTALEEALPSSSRVHSATVLPTESKKKSSITTAASVDLSCTLPTGRDESIFTLLHQLMQELHEVRVRQDEMIDAMILSSSSSRHLSPSLQARINSKVTSSGSREEEAVSIVDLRPIPVAVPWQVRQQIMEAAQPVTHPILGHSLSDFVRADRQHTRSLFGFRLEGLTLDSAFQVPEDVCFLFSFGPLPFQKVGPAQTIHISANGLQQNADGAPLMNVIFNRTPREELQGRSDAVTSNKSGAQIEKALQKSYRFVDVEGRGGFVWMEPVDSSALGVPQISMEYFKQYHSGRSVLYLHIYDALTMFYVCTAPIPFSHFYRPYHAEAALIPLDLPVQRDLSLTAQPVPEQVFPVILHAGQLHLTLVCVGVPPAPSSAAPTSFPSLVSGGSDSTRNLPIPLHRLVEPQNGSRLVLAKKLPSVQPFLSATEDNPMRATGSGIIAYDSPGSAAEVLLPKKDGSTLTSTRTQGPYDDSAVPPPLPPPLRSSMAHHRHWQRAEVFKKVMKLQREMGLAPTPLPGVPDAHLRLAALQVDPTTMEYRLRLIERERDIAKSKAITTALKERITIRHEMCITSWRPETLQTPFINPFHTAVTFTVDIPPSDLAHCSTATRSFILGPMERTSIPLVVRLHDRGVSHSPWSREGGGNPSDTTSSPLMVKLLAKVYAPQHQLIRVIEIVVSILPPQIDRRLEVYGPPGTTVTKKCFSRQYSSSSLPSSCKSVPSLDGSSVTTDAVSRLSLLCAAVTCSSSATTTAKTVAMLDPITQNYVTAWEEVVITTSIPTERGEQRLEYVTLYQDAACTQTLEVWELCVFACYAITTREISWGQTTTIALPTDDSEDLYCSSSCVKVEGTPSSYLLHIRPTAIGSEGMLLHTLQNGSLVKTLLTVPVAYPTPTATQVIELSMDDVQSGPVQRRLTFVNHGDKEEHFTIHQNYTYQLYISPSRFLLAPGDVQPIHLRIGPLALPDGQLEGRWPMWIFINNSSDKTIESYYLQVVLRLHPVVPHAADR